MNPKGGRSEAIFYPQGDRSGSPWLYSLLPTPFRSTGRWTMAARPGAVGMREICSHEEKSSYPHFFLNKFHGAGVIPPCRVVKNHLLLGMAVGAEP
jgi:hypothetical protein